MVRMQIKLSLYATNVDNKKRKKTYFTLKYFPPTSPGVFVTL